MSWIQKIVISGLNIVWKSEIDYRFQSRINSASTSQAVLLSQKVFTVSEFEADISNQLLSEHLSECMIKQWKSLQKK